MVAPSPHSELESSISIVQRIRLDAFPAYSNLFSEIKINRILFLPRRPLRIPTYGGNVFLESRRDFRQVYCAARIR